MCSKSHRWNTVVNLMSDLKEKEEGWLGGRLEKKKNMPYVKYFLSQRCQSLCAILCCNDSSPLRSRLLLGNPYVSDSSEKQLQGF